MIELISFQILRHALIRNSKYEFRKSWSSYILKFWDRF
ncbi:hypothetical protein LSS_22405 [Leptospira santarosai serovar Shermani str. LT 821]|uniref:Uncharacterized protein n=1 Tax=Leptospira santarosai serovar Shermani str. LT 821 TaxID=758847 RepID=A0A097ESV7_9LEPT|nr:hypothetical protein LSS_22405 [Leptospira santarosai serovar Shermani str. LT 821]